MAGVSKLLQVDREVSKTRREALKARPQPAPAPAEPEAIATLPPSDLLPPAEPHAEPVSPVTPAPQISVPTPQPTPPSRRSRWANWLVALAIVASVSMAAFDVWRRLQPAARKEPQPAPRPVDQPPQEPAPVQEPSAPAEATNEQGAATGTAREETANVLKLMERALRNAARAVNAAQADSRD